MSPSRVLDPAATAADDTIWADEEARTVVGMEDIIAEDIIAEDIIADDEELAVALAFPIMTAKPDGPGPIPTADERTSPRNPMKA